MKVNSFSELSVFLVIVIIFGFAFTMINLTGCLKKNQSASEFRQPRQAVENVLSDLEKAVNRENYSGVLELIHPDFRQFKNELRNEMRKVFRQFSQIELEFYASRVNKTQAGLNVVANWNLRWVCSAEDAGIGCAVAGQTVRRKGRTTFELAKDSSKTWKIKSQRADKLLGSLTPGKQLHP